MYQLNTTRRRTAATLVALAAVPALVLSLGPSTAVGSTSATTLRFHQREGTFRFIDLPPKASDANPAPSAGDYFVLTNRLFRAGERIGTLHATCVVTRRVPNPDNTPLLCTGVYRLRGGTLAGTAVLGSSQTTNHIAITGGTGRFAGASGTSTERVNEDGTSDVIVRLQ